MACENKVPAGFTVSRRNGEDEKARGRKNDGKRPDGGRGCRVSSPTHLFALDVEGGAGNTG
jgi:hypothetical protein